jgi:hypothetical protein
VRGIGLRGAIEEARRRLAAHRGLASNCLRYLETMTQTPKTTLPAKAKAATAPSTT